MTGTTWPTRLHARILETALNAAVLTLGLFEGVFPILGLIGLAPPTTTREVQIAATALVPGAATTGPVTLHGTNTAVLDFSNPALGQELLLILPQLVRTALFIVVLDLLRRMACTLRDGDVFVPQNVRRLRGVSVALMLVGVLVPLLTAVTTDLLISGTSAGAAVETFYLGFSIRWVLIGALTVAASMAFGYGTRLRADTEGLV